MFTPTNCLRAVEVEKGEVIVWGKHLNKKGVFQLKQEGMERSGVEVKLLKQEKEVPNCDHGSAVRVFNSKIYAFDQYKSRFWEFSAGQWNIANSVEVEPKAFGI